MEIGKHIVFGEIKFEILDIFVRTVGSAGQRLISLKEKNTNKQMLAIGRTFYLVRGESGVLRWVKEYTDPNFGIFGEASYEFYRMNSFGSILIGGNSISPVLGYACESNRILMEYYDYFRLVDIYKGLGESIWSTIKGLCSEWVKRYHVVDYDFCANNILISRDNHDWITLKLLDFECSPKTEPVYDYLMKSLERCMK